MVNERILCQKDVKKRAPAVFTVGIGGVWIATTFMSVFCICLALFIGLWRVRFG